VGECLGEFHATYYRIPGQFFVATRALLFYSNWLGFERRFCLTFSDIETIQSYRSTSIKISMVDCEEYVFKKFRDRDAVVLVLQELLMRYQVAVDKGEDLVDPPIISRAFHQSAVGGFTDENLTTTNTAPQEPLEAVPTLLTSSPHDLEDDDDSGLQTQAFRRPHLASEHAPAQWGVSEFGDVVPNRRRSMSVPTVVGYGDSRHQVTQNVASTTLPPNTKPPATPKRSFLSHFGNNNRAVSTGKLEQQHTMLSRKTRNSSYHSENGDHSLLDESCQQLFTHPIAPPSKGPQLSKQQEAQYDELLDLFLKENKAHEQVALEPTILEATPSEIFDWFFHDAAPHSLAKYQQEKIGDKDVRFSAWKSSDSGSSAHVKVLERDIDYIHPLNNAMGPSEAKTFRKQKLWQYGDHAIIIQNVTSVEGIPMADCFQVHDQWIIVPSKDAGSTSLTLSVSFQVEFVKRTMFKSLIQKNVKAETKKWFQGYVQMLREALEEHKLAGPNGAEVLEPVESLEGATSANENVMKEIEISTNMADDARLRHSMSIAKTFEIRLPPIARIFSLDVFTKVILLGVFILLVMQLRAMNSRLVAMEHHLVALERQNEEWVTQFERYRSACVNGGDGNA
jgi:VAD1 Analog of StAR-related lipid transfer domain